jgi:hypothetical protein
MKTTATSSFVPIKLHQGSMLGSLFCFFSDFYQFWAKILRFYQKPMLLSNFSKNLATFIEKNAKFLAKIFKNNNIRPS